MRILRARLLQAEQDKQHAEVSAARKEQVKGGGRSEKIRTYNYKENRVTDHRIGLTHAHARPGARRRPRRDRRRARGRRAATPARRRVTRRTWSATRAEVARQLAAARHRDRRSRGAVPRRGSVGLRGGGVARDRRRNRRPSAPLARLGPMVDRRIAGEPLQYVLGSWNFRGLDLMVDRRVLIPRPETEQVVEVALEEAERHGLRRARRRRLALVDAEPDRGRRRSRHRLGRDRARARRRASRRRWCGRPT